MARRCRPQALAATLGLIILGAAAGRAGDVGAAAGHLAAGQAALAEKGWARAQREFTSALWIDSDHPAAHCGLGQAQMRQKRYAAAAESFANCKRALEQVFARVRTGATRAEEDRARTLLELRDYISYLEYTEGSISSQGEGSNFSSITRTEQQMKLLRRDQGAQPLSLQIPAEVSFSLGSAQLQAGRLEEAETSLLEALAVRPEFGAAHNNLAVVYLRTGRVSAARAEVESAEDCGFEVHPGLKSDLEDASKDPSPRE